MYDPRSEWKEFVGANRVEALGKASSFFGVREDELEVVEPPPGEVFGLSARVLLIAALRERKQKTAPSRPPERPPERFAGRQGEGRGESRSREPRRGAESERPSVQPAQPSPTPEREEPSVGTARSALTPVGEFVLGLLERMEVGPFELSEGREGDLIAISLRGPAAMKVTAGDARSIDAIQLLANQALPRTGDENLRVVVDAEGDSDRREAYLARLAERAAQRASETGRSVAIDPMNPKDRRIVHVALREFDGVVTMSVGSGRYRQVVVVPEGAPEYEEARRQAEAASNRGER
ncbi:MAG TPA: R3H domain-containing nucleic acid-binding protein [Myxococcota bacterium]|nr:R3H domain-containing nucleic acid-binding protein [Myxococcota bacterium]